MRPSKDAVLEGQLFRARLDELDAFGLRCEHEPAASLGEHLRALVDPDDGAALLPHELERDCSGAGGQVDHHVRGPHSADARDEELPPARVLAEGEQARVAVVARTERREQLPGARLDHTRV